jgi:uncharacterized protein (TIGR03083 family)
MDWIAELDRATSSFASVLDDGDLEAAVPACPGWTLRELADHLGGVHHWARHAVVEGNPQGSTEPAPRERADLAAWYRGNAERLVRTLAETPEDAPVWSFGPEPHTAAFWRRRQVHETTMHLWDAQASQGRRTELDPAVALDGLDEVAHVFYPRQVHLGRTAPLPAGLRLEATDAADHPGIALGDGPAVTLEGPAATLLLLLWHRVDLDEAGERGVRVDGDRAQVAHLLDHAITP